MRWVWGCSIKRILHSRLPERLAGRVPPLLVEAVIGIVAGLLMVAARLPFQGLVGERAPYAFNFLAVVLAAVLAGWRAGLIALVVAQLMTFFAIVGPAIAAGAPPSDRVAGLFVASLSELLILVVIALYQREVARGVYERERRLDLLNEAVREIAHRTRNNYQTVLALVQLQSQRAETAAVKNALQQVADRIQAIAGATERLALRSDDLDTVRLRDHLCDLCEHVERGLSRDGVKVSCEVADLSASTEKATYISIIVNELVTNALKHAFNGAGSGHIRVTTEQEKNGHVAIIVEDDGHGFKAGNARGRTGLGMQLVRRFTQELGGVHEVDSSANGTRHRVLVPSLGTD